MTTLNRLSEEIARRSAQDDAELLNAAQKILSVARKVAEIGAAAYTGGTSAAISAAFPALTSIIGKFAKGDADSALIEGIKKLLPGNTGEEAMKILMANKDRILSDTASSLAPQILDIAKRFLERNSNSNEGKVAAALIGGLQTSISSLFAGVPEEQRKRLLDAFLDNIGKIGDLAKNNLQQIPDPEERAERGRQLIGELLHTLFSNTLRQEDKVGALNRFIDDLSRQLGDVLGYDPQAAAPAAAAAAAAAPAANGEQQGRGEIKYGGSYPFWADGSSELSGSGIEDFIINGQSVPFNMSSFSSYSNPGFSNPEADILLNATNATNLADILNSSATAATTGSTAPQEQTWGEWGWSALKTLGNGALSLGGTVVRSLLPLVPIAAQFGLQALHNKTMARDNNNKMGRFLLNVDEFFSDPTKAALFNQALGQTVNYIGNQWDMKRNRDAVMKAYQDEIARSDLANQERNRIYTGELAHARSERDDANRTINAENNKLREEYNQEVRKRRQQVGQNVEANLRTQKENEIKQANYEKKLAEAEKKYQTEKADYITSQINDLLLQRGNMQRASTSWGSYLHTSRAQQNVRDLREGITQKYPPLRVFNHLPDDAFLNEINDKKVIGSVRKYLEEQYDKTHTKATVDLPTYGTMLPTDDPKNYLAMPKKPTEKPQVLTTRYVKPPETILPPRFPTEALLALNRQTPQNYVPPLLMQAPTKTSSSTTTSKYPYDADTLEEAIERLPYVKSPLKDPPTFVNPGPVGTSTPLNTVRVPSQSQKETIQTRPLSTSSYRNVFAQEEPHPIKMQDGSTTYGFVPKKRASVNSFQSSLTFNMPYDTVPQDPSVHELYPSAKRRRTSSGKKGSSKK